MIDMLELAPLAVRRLAERDAGHRADKRALMKRPKCNAVWCRPVYWEGARNLLSGKTSMSWTKHHQA
eukprot:4271150-Pyramimonas_sp.AAC.1